MPKAPINENDSQKLIRLGNMRVNKVLQALRMVGNLGSYNPTADQITKISSAMQTEMTKQLTRLKTKGADDSGVKVL